MFVPPAGMSAVPTNRGALAGEQFDVTRSNDVLAVQSSLARVAD
jgi:hypothetical protein